MALSKPIGSSCLSALEPLPLDGPFAIDAAFQDDNESEKVNLSIGVYRHEDSQPWLLPSVAEAKRRLNIDSRHHDYLPPAGCPEFVSFSKRFLFGDEYVQQNVDAMASIQTVSGTGANSLIARFLQRHLHPINIWLPSPTWANHERIWLENAPEVKLRHYPYYDASARSLDFEGMMAALKEDAQPNDVVLFHACAHNPTGLDPTEENWRTMARLCEEKQFFVVFDSAYQGFASGDLDNDAWAIRHFASQHKIDLAVCQSFSKNLGLYGERVGALHVISRISSAFSRDAIESHLVYLQRADISVPPHFGALVAATVFSDDLMVLWKQDIATMSARIKSMRKALYTELVRLQTPGKWEHILEQRGMFSYTGLSSSQVDRLMTEHHVYLLPSGRASMCGLTTKNVAHVARAIHSVVTCK